MGLGDVLTLTMKAKVSKTDYIKQQLLHSKQNGPQGSSSVGHRREALADGVSEKGLAPKPDKELM